jgi:hypothetical protein
MDSGDARHQTWRRCGFGALPLILRRDQGVRSVSARSTETGTMTDKPPPAIVRTNYRHKPPPKRKTPVAIPMRIVEAKPPQKHLRGAVRRLGGDKGSAPAPEVPRIVTTTRKGRGRFGAVPDMTPEEHQQRGDAAEALFRELARRAREG